MIAFDATFWVAVSIVALVVCIFKPVRRMLVLMLDDRSARIQKELDEAVRLKEEAEDLLVSYKRKQKEVMDEAKRILDHAGQEVERLTREAHVTLEAELVRRETLAMQKISSYEHKVVQEIREHAVDSAVRAIHTLASQHMESDVATKLVDDSIKDISRTIH